MPEEHRMDTFQVECVDFVSLTTPWLHKSHIHCLPYGWPLTL